MESAQSLQKALHLETENPLIQRRLDVWLISNFLQDDRENVNILTSVKSDHSAIILDIDSVKNIITSIFLEI